MSFVFSRAVLPDAAPTSAFEFHSFCTVQMPKGSILLLVFWQMMFSVRVGNGKKFLADVKPSPTASALCSLASAEPSELMGVLARNAAPPSLRLIGAHLAP